MSITGTRGGAHGILKGHGVTVLAWLSFALAAVGGSALMVSFVGPIVAGILHLFPDWVPALALLAGLVTLVIDLLNDGIPNKAAIWVAITVPSVALGSNGQLSAACQRIARQILGLASERASAWVGQGSAIAVAAFAITVALLVAKRVVRKGGG